MQNPVSLFFYSHQSKNLYYLGFSHQVHSCFPTAFSNQVLVIMSDATKKANLKYLLFQESPDIFFPLSVGECFPCVAASLTFERRFCPGGLCFLTSGSGIFRC